MKKKYNALLKTKQIVFVQSFPNVWFELHSSISVSICSSCHTKNKVSKRVFFETFHYFEQHMFLLFFLFSSRNTTRDNFSNRSIIWPWKADEFFTRIDRDRAVFIINRENSWDLPRIRESSFTCFSKKREFDVSYSEKLQFCAQNIVIVL